jgi:beta-glucosidase
LQIEGGLAAGGRGASIWDKVKAGEPLLPPEPSADHFRRWPEDVRLLQDLGVSYRFSVAWPRVMPEGGRTINTRGLDFYDRLVDALLAVSVTPWGCLHH